MNAQATMRGKKGTGGSFSGLMVAAVFFMVGGAAVAAVWLALQPVTRVKVLPKEADRVRGEVYFVEGKRDPARARGATEKIESLLRGQVVTLAEEDLNALLEAAMTAKGKAPSDALVTPGVPNVRIRDGVVQLASELTVDLIGPQQKIMFQARGTFREEAGVWVFEPAEMLLGGLPLNRVPFAAGWVRARLLDPRQFHPDLATAWSRVGRIAVEGNVVKVSLR